MRHADAGYEAAIATAREQSLKLPMIHPDRPMRAIDITYLNGPDVEPLALTDDEILAAVEAGARRAGARRDRDRAARAPDARKRLPTAISTCCAATSRRSAWPASRWSATSSTTTSSGLPSEMALLNLFDPEHRRAAWRSSTPAAITDMRTGAVTAHRRQASRAQGLARCSAISARAAPPTGTCACSIDLFDFDEIRVHSRRPESRDAFAARLSKRSRQAGHGDDGLGDLRRGADIVVEASRLPEAARRC